MTKRCVILFLFFSIFILFITSCGSTSANTSTNANTTETTTPATEPKEPAMSTPPVTTTPITTTPVTEGPKPTTITIDETFKIVYSSSASAAEKEAANQIINAMSHFGVTLSVQKDTASQSGNEILIGNTSRAQSKSALEALSAGGYSLSISENEANGVSLVLAAIDEDGLELATKHLILNYLSVDKKATLPFSLSVTHTKDNVTLQEKYQLSDYTVVYAKEGILSDVNIQSAKYADAARDFASLVEKFTGHTLTVVPDTADLSQYQHLILFGNTSAPDDNVVYSASFFKGGVKLYGVRMLDNGNISLAGNNPVSAYAAGEALLAAIAENNNRVNELEFTGQKDIIHVACLGDSITFGTGSADPSIHCYPVYYQRMLGYNYYVEKYGLPSHSLIETDQPSYLNHDYFRKSAAAKPDVVIVMLGTNDTRPSRWADSAYKDWSDPARTQAFLNSGNKLVENYRKANPDVQIIFATCPFVQQAADWTNNLIKYGNPLINQIASTNDCSVIDIFTYTKKNIHMFAGGDGLHLKDENYEKLAKGFYELTKNIIKK